MKKDKGVSQSNDTAREETKQMMRKMDKVKDSLDSMVVASHSVK